MQFLHKDEVLGKLPGLCWKYDDEKIHRCVSCQSHSMYKYCKECQDFFNANPQVSVHIRLHHRKGNTQAVCNGDCGLTDDYCETCHGSEDGD